MSYDANDLVAKVRMLVLQRSCQQSMSTRARFRPLAELAPDLVVGSQTEVRLEWTACDGRQLL